ncbi:MAG TPA: hypothetical protein VMV10_23170 [Pirellulales bacterium]|nr:hypothetical protein [Pirellulales bacterium]
MMIRLGLAATFLSILGVAGCGDTTAPEPKIVAPAEPHSTPAEPHSAAAEPHSATAGAPAAAPTDASVAGNAEQDAASRARSLPLGKQRELFDATNQLTQGKELTAAQLKLLREFRGLAGIDESLKIYQQRHPEAAAESNEPEAEAASDASASAAAEPGDDETKSPAADAAKSAPAGAPETNDGKNDSGE